MDSISLHYYLNHFIKKNGLTTIRFAVIFNRQTSIIVLPIDINGLHWDKNNEMFYPEFDEKYKVINDQLIRLKEVCSERLKILVLSHNLNKESIKIILRKLIQSYFNNYKQNLDKNEIKQLIYKNALPIYNKGESGIYFLLLNGKVIYIGKTTNLILRLNNHCKNKKFNSYYFYQCPIEELNFQEAKFIREFRTEIDNKVLF